ncbi:ATPase associated with various cellular activities family protein [Mycobacteroides abscessus 1948]|uniref:ATPase associated with various cellular activities family protein n=1 Tax=Mycobacteroides abscessus 1948 TaxID=1299323 RepID=A0A829QCC6_9MYCO|nr:ATPase associated with various cellular activities family protein [Mycobacteroides abscessus 1948]
MSDPLRPSGSSQSRTQTAPLFTSIDDVTTRLAETGYLADTATATAVFLADRLGKPLLVEGPAGVGKTELARAVAHTTGSGLVRLQCYEGVDEARARSTSGITPSRSCVFRPDPVIGTRRKPTSSPRSSCCRGRC